MCINHLLCGGYRILQLSVCILESFAEWCLLKRVSCAYTVKLCRGVKNNLCIYRAI